MINNMKKQSGVTFIGLVFILGTIALVVIFVLRAFPLYNEKFQVTAAANSVASKADPDSRQPSLIPLTISSTRSGSSFPQAK